MFDSIREDVRAFREHDPAATSTISILVNSPGMRAVWAYRRQHWLWTHGHRFLARTLSTWSRHRFGVEIHPGATIGRRFLIDHGSGIVVGETTIIGDDCMIYQGVTLGGTGKQTGKRHPTLGDNVLVGAGAKVLGPFTVGDNARVAAGAVVLDAVPPNATAVGVPARVVRIDGQKVAEAPPSKKLDQIHVADPVSMELCRLRGELERLEKKVAEMEKTPELEQAGSVQDESY